MRLGNLRGVTFAIALVSISITSGAARADWFHDVIPRDTPAMDYRTGGQYYAPPIPYGHYTKDKLGSVHEAIGGVKGKLHGLGGLGGHGLACNSCGGRGCNSCGGRGFFGHGDGNGGGSGCGPNGCGGGHGLGLGRGLGQGCGGGHGLGLGHGLGQGCGSGCKFGKHGQGFNLGCDTCGTGLASAQGPVSIPQVSPQSVVATGQSGPCGSRGCLSKFHHHHGSNAGCGLCGGSGLGIGQGLGQGFGQGQCGSCGGRGCGLCGGKGLGIGHGQGQCGSCGGRGCGLCGGRGQGSGGCGLCGGRGCTSCLSGLAAKGHGMLNGLLHPHAGKIRYFVGPGGPVPITPGYVPYIVTTRSPRDFLSFPPFTP